MSIPIVNKLKKQPKKLQAKRFFVFLAVFVALLLGFLFVKAGHTFSLVSDGGLWSSHEEQDDYTEKDRIDILILGIRGENDEFYGGTLADTIMLLSIKTDIGKSSLVSIPRDLYVKIPRHDNQREKLNYAYAFGENKNIGGMDLTKQIIERVAGVYIDYGVVIDFETFRNLIDAVGGVDVYLEEEFLEQSQWGWEFRVPAGENHMDGETALYYARSRFSSDDFDRSRRQQEIISALKNKLTDMGVLANPKKLNDIFTSIGEGVKTNMDFTTMVSFIKYASYLDEENLTKKVLNVSEGGLLQAGTIDEKYVLYPEAGLDNFTDIKKEVRNIFDK